MKYDVFISYRRKGGTEIARAIKAELEKMGYTVFLDFDSLHDGHFDSRISEAISSSEIFMLVLSQNSLDSCVNEGDWLRKEIEYALETNRHIVPVNPDQKFQQFPETLPDTLKEQLPYIQISDLMLGQLFQASLDKVIKERILPYINPTDFSAKLHIKSDKDCKFLSFNEPLGNLSANVFSVFTFNKGRYLFSFVSSEGELREIEYEVNDKTDDYLLVDFDKKTNSPKRWVWYGLTLLALVLCVILISYVIKSKDKSSVYFSEDMTSFSINGVPFEMVYVEGGRFSMGATDTIQAEKDEFPVHTTNVPSFLIGKYPVTQEQWECIMGINPSYYKGDNLPVEGVTWFDAQEFVRKLSLLTGKDFDLPTEAEWEYAARGGKNSKGYIYSGSNDPNEVGWFNNNSESGTHAVGKKTPNELGIYDMSGNVWEWCWDYYGPDYYANCFDSISPVGPQGLPKSNWRVFRGGSIQLPQNFMRVSNRDSFEPSGKDHDIGFRLKLKL